MTLKKVPDLSPQEFRFLVEEGLTIPEDGKVDLDIPQGFYLKVPRIEIERDVRFLAKYSPELEKSISEGITRLGTKKGDAYVQRLKDMFDRIEQRQMRHNIQEEQEAMMGWVARRQEKYLLGGDPRDLRDVGEDNICNAADFRGYGWAPTRVGKLMANLSVRLPEGPMEGDIVFAKELAPGAQTMVYRGVHVLRQLMKDPNYFSGGRWNVTDKELNKTLRSYGIRLNECTLGYRKKILESYLK